MKNNCEGYENQKLLHICEVCGLQESLTPKEGYDKGWDYAPYMYPFRVVTPRSCPNCGITKTVWFELVAKHTPLDKLTEKQIQIIKRIQEEPKSILPKE